MSEEPLHRAEQAIDEAKAASEEPMMPGAGEHDVPAGPEHPEDTVTDAS